MRFRAWALAPLFVFVAAISLAAEQAPAPVVPAPELAAPAPDAAPPPASETPPPAAAAPVDPAALNFAAPESVIDLGPSLAPRAVNDPADAGGAWFTLTVRNGSSVLPVARVFTAADAAEAGARIFPSATRPELTEIAGSDAAVVVERAPAFGDNAIRVVLPPGHMATLALHLRGASARPPVLAWTEPSLIAHNRQIAILEGLVSGLFTAAVAFAAGAAVLSGRIFAWWATLFLGAALVAHLASVGVFDSSLFALRGPYGLVALALAVALAAAIRMLDFIASFDAIRPGAGRWRDRVAAAIVVLGLLAYFGVPFVGLLLRILAVVGAAAASGYFAHAGRLGIAGARRLAPAATIFALVSAAAASNALGLFGVNLVAAGAIGGFAAAGALLVALTTSIPMESARSRFRELREAHRNDDVQAVVTDEALETQREIAAVTASHQGVFDLDLHTGLLSLSAEAAAMFGLPKGAVELSRETWLARIHEEDRGIYEQALEVYRHDPGAAFRLEFRATIANGQTDWFELRATMTGQSTEAERCLGLVGNVTARRSAEDAFEAAHDGPDHSDRVHVQSSALEAPPPRDVAPLQAELRRAMKDGEIEVQYQPVMRLKDGAIAGFDVLLRWRGEQGLVEPGHFAAQAEESGMIGALVLFALRAAASDLARWQRSFPANPPLFVTVNVAWRHIADRSFAHELTNAMRSDGFAAKTLKLKLTESAPAESAQVQAVLKTLQKLGIAFAIGDFSVFNAARAHTVRVPFDTIVIDKAIVENARDPLGTAILNSSVGLARELKAAAIAEGVESGDDVTRLQRIGCDYGQGPFYGLPLRGPEVDGFIFTRTN